MANYKLHDPTSPLLLGTLKDTDEVIEGKQISFLKKEDGCLSLF